MKRSFLHTMRDAFSTLTSRPLTTLSIYGADLLFFSCYIVIHTLTVVRAIPHFEAISTLVAENGDALSPLANESVASAFPVDAFRAEFIAIILAVLLLLASTFVLFCLIEGFAWWKTQKLLGAKVPFARYLARFTALGIVWSIAVACVLYASIQLSSLDLIVGLFGDIAWLGEGAVAIAVLAISYLAVAGFSLCAAHTFRDMLRRVWTASMILPFVAALSLVVASFAFLWVLSKVSPILVVPGVLLVMIPAVMYGRMLLVASGSESEN